MNDEIIYFLRQYGFKTYFRSKTKEVDLDLFDVVLKIKEVTYLYYSSTHKLFTIATKHDPKGLAGGGFKELIKVMIPKLIYTTEDAKKLVESIIY